MSDRYDYKRKKLRGWKRKVKEVERWQSNYINMDVELFRKKLETMSNYGAVHFIR